MITADQIFTLIGNLIVYGCYFGGIVIGCLLVWYLRKFFIFLALVWFIGFLYFQGYLNF